MQLGIASIMHSVSSFQFRSLGLIGISAWLTILAMPSVDASSLPINKADWYDGVVVLVDDKVLSGEIHYNASHQLVLLRSDDGQTITTLTSRQVQRFFYYNPQDNIIHRFLAIEQLPHPTYAVRSFYEVVAEGPVLYLRQPNQCSAHPPPGSSPHVVAFRYFAYYRGKIVRARAFQKELLPALAQESPALIEYIKSQQLKPYHVGDQIVLVNYFNRQFSEPLAALGSFR
jgi:hypothetical protein